MKTNPDDCAYANTQVVNSSEGEFMYNFSHSGLTKREYFAALGMHAHINANLTNGQMITGDGAAKGALAAADALIKALNEEQVGK